MKYYGLPVVLAALAITAAASTNSQAAVTVVGNGLAHSCFRSAEFGGDARAGVETCTAALAQGELNVADRAATFVNRGILEARLDQKTSALSDYNEGIRLRVNLAEAYVDRGATLIALDRDDDALADLSKGIELGANRPQVAYYDRAIVREKMGNIRGAYDDYKMAVSLAPDFALATEQLHRFRVIHKDNDGA